jgi:hypothetical protein
VNGFTGEAYQYISVKCVKRHTNDDPVMITDAACIHSGRSKQLQMRQVKNTYLICLGLIKQTQQVTKRSQVVLVPCVERSLRIMLLIIAVLAAAVSSS